MNIVVDLRGVKEEVVTIVPVVELHGACLEPLLTAALLETESQALGDLS